MLTVWCIAVTVGSLFLIGLPLARGLWKADSTEETWVLAPLIGQSIVILALQNLVYLNVPVRISTPLLWLGTAGLWLWLRKTRGLRAQDQPPPWALLALGATTYLIQGSGLLIAGVAAYVGRAWHDQLNYTLVAQLLADYRFSLPLEAVDNHPYLVRAIQLRQDRIGQSVLQAFFATSTLTDAKTAFEPTILLAPPLTALTSYLLARRCGAGRAASLSIGLAAGTLPAIAAVHLECFLSQALAIPLLLLWPIVIADVASAGGWRRQVIAALLLAAATSMYIEVYPVFLALAAIVLVGQARAPWPEIIATARRIVVVVGLALLLNPGFVRSIVKLTQRASVSRSLTDVYPWAYSADGLMRLWLGDLPSFLSPRLQWPLVAIAGATIGLVALAYLGLALVWWARRNSFVTGLLGLGLSPLLIWGYGKGSDYGYQFYKMALSLSPLLALGVGVAVARTTAWLHPRSRVGAAVMRGLAAGLLIVSCGATLHMAIRSARETSSTAGRGGAHKLLAPATRRMERLLAQHGDQAIVIMWYDNFFGGGFLNGWLAYFARGHHVWLVNPRVGDTDIPLASRPDETTLPRRALLLTSASLSRYLFTSGWMLWADDPYQIWQLPNKSWVAIVRIERGTTLVDMAEESDAVVGKRGLTLRLFAGRAGMVTLSLTIGPESNPLDCGRRDLLVTTGPSYGRRRHLVYDGLCGRTVTERVAVPVVDGASTIQLRVLDAATLGEADAPTMFVRLGDWRIVGFD
jgi:hypothetical protein